MIKKFLLAYHSKRMWHYVAKRCQFANPNQDKRTVQLVLNNENKIKYHHLKYLKLHREIYE